MPPKLFINLDAPPLDVESVGVARRNLRVSSSVSYFPLIDSKGLLILFIII